jgi:hypothetical protein
VNTGLGDGNGFAPEVNGLIRLGGVFADPEEAEETEDCSTPIAGVLERTNIEVSCEAVELSEGKSEGWFAVIELTVHVFETLGNLAVESVAG